METICKIKYNGYSIVVICPNHTILENTPDQILKQVQQQKKIKTYSSYKEAYKKGWRARRIGKINPFNKKNKDILCPFCAKQAQTTHERYYNN